MILGKMLLIWWNITVDNLLVRASLPRVPGGIVE
jgi:hypothetical protein